MYVLIMKNTEAKLVHVEKFSVSDYCFPSVQLAEMRGQEILAMKDTKYTQFNTMDVNHFIETMTDKFGVGL